MYARSRQPLPPKARLVVRVSARGRGRGVRGGEGEG